MAILLCAIMRPAALEYVQLMAPYVNLDEIHIPNPIRGAEIIERGHSDPYFRHPA
jgi:hypothetical protein